EGDLANWMIPGKMVKGMGGAMDLVQGAKKVVVIMDHVNKHGETKVRKTCTLPVTGLKVVDRLITDRAVFDFTDEGMVLRETLGGATVEEIQECTEAEFTVAEDLLKGAAE